MNKMTNLQKLFADADMSLQEIIINAQRMIREDEAVVNVYEVIKARPLDGARAFRMVVEETIGWIGQSMGTSVSLETGPGEFVNVPWGNFTIPGIEGTLNSGADMYEDEFPVFVIKGQVKKRDMGKVVELANLTRQRILTDSVYRGKAIVLEMTPNAENLYGSNPSFFKYNGAKPLDLVLPTDTYNKVSAGVFTPITHADECRRKGIQTKRSVVLDGNPGTGKTLTMAIAAGLCVRNCKTFVLLRDVNRLEEAIRYLQFYGFLPALIAAEDIDRVMSERDEDANNILNAIDGVDSKNMNISFLLTTNHRDKLIETFQRSGRSDWIITLPMPDAQAAAQLLKRYADDEFVLSDEEYLRVGTILAAGPTLPANIRECCERSKLYQIDQEASEVDFELLRSVAVGVVEEKSQPTAVVVQPLGVLETVANKVNRLVTELVEE